MNGTAHINYFAVEALNFVWIKLEEFCAFACSFEDLDFAVKVLHGFALLFFKFADGAADFYSLSYGSEDLVVGCVYFFS